MLGEFKLEPVNAGQAVVEVVGKVDDAIAPGLQSPQQHHAVTRETMEIDCVPAPGAGCLGVGIEFALWRL